MRNTSSFHLDFCVSKRTVDNEVERTPETIIEKVKEKIGSNFAWMEKSFKNKLIDATLATFYSKQLKKTSITDDTGASFHVPKSPNKFKKQRSDTFLALKHKSPFSVSRDSDKKTREASLQRLQMKSNGTDFKCKNGRQSSFPIKVLDPYKKLTINSSGRSNGYHNQFVDTMSKDNKTTSRVKPPNFPSILNKQQQKMPLSSTPIREPSSSLNTTGSSCKLTSSKPSFLINETVKIIEMQEYKMLIEQFSQNHLFSLDKFPLVKKYSSYCKANHSSDKNVKGTAFDDMKENDCVSRDTYKTPVQLHSSKSSRIEDDEPLVLELEPETVPPFPSKMQASPFMSSEWIEGMKETMNEKIKRREKRVEQTERQIREYEKKRAERKEKLIKEYEKRRDEKKRAERIARLKKESENFSLDGYGIENVLFDKERIILPELTPEMNKTVDEALMWKQPDTVITNLSNFTVLYKDLETLTDCKWVNDEIINSYMYLIQQRSKLPEYPSVYVFNSFFFPRLKASGHSAVKRWTRKEDIFKYDMNLVPLHLGVHWCLAVIDHKHKKIGYYDSMLCKDNGSLSILRQYLIGECKDKKQKEFDTTGWEFERVQDIPPQLNGSDCGMFTLKYAEYISRNAEINFTQQHMPYFRRKAIYEIIVGHLV